MSLSLHLRHMSLSLRLSVHLSWACVCVSMSVHLCVHLSLETYERLSVHLCLEPAFASLSLYICVSMSVHLSVESYETHLRVSVHVDAPACVCASCVYGAFACSGCMCVYGAFVCRGCMCVSRHTRRLHLSLQTYERMSVHLSLFVRAVVFLCVSIWV